MSKLAGGGRGGGGKWLRSSISAYLSVALVRWFCSSAMKYSSLEQVFLLPTTCFPLNPIKRKLFIRVPFAFLFCTIVGLKKLEMGASIHRPIFARGPAHYSAEEKRYYSTYTLRTYFFTYNSTQEMVSSSRVRSLPPLPPSWPLCLVRSSCC